MAGVGRMDGKSACILLNQFPKAFFSTAQRRKSVESMTSMYGLPIMLLP